MKYVYIGNAPSFGGESTYCPSCGELIIKRDGFKVISEKGKIEECPTCKTKIDIVTD